MVFYNSYLKKGTQFKKERAIGIKILLIKKLNKTANIHKQ